MHTLPEVACTILKDGRVAAYVFENSGPIAESLKLFFETEKGAAVFRHGALCFDTTLTSMLPTLLAHENALAELKVRLGMAGFEMVLGKQKIHSGFLRY